MTEKIYYVENDFALNLALELIAIVVPCFINREYIEMDYSRITIVARNEDIATIEKIFADLV